MSNTVRFTVHGISSSQCAETILDEIANHFHKTFSYASCVSDILFMKSYIEGHRIHQLGSESNLAWVRLNWAKSAELPG